MITPNLEDRLWSSPWAYVLLAVLVLVIIGECVWLVR
jgi:hypothetical protein